MLSIALTMDSSNSATSTIMCAIFICKSRDIRPRFFIGGSRNGVKSRGIATKDGNPITSIIKGLNISKGPPLASHEDYPVTHRFVGAYPIQGVKVVHTDFIQVDAIVG